MRVLVPSTIHILRSLALVLVLLLCTSTSAKVLERVTGAEFGLLPYRTEKSCSALMRVVDTVAALVSRSTPNPPPEVTNLIARMGDARYPERRIDEHDINILLDWQQLWVGKSSEHKLLESLLQGAPFALLGRVFIFAVRVSSERHHPRLFQIFHERLNRARGNSLAQLRRAATLTPRSLPSEVLSMRRDGRS